MRLRPVLGVVAALVVLALTVVATAVVVTDRVDDPRRPQPVTATAVAERHDLEEVVRLRGVIGGRTLPPLVASVAGRVTAVEVVAGEVVDAGDRLLDVDGRPVLALPGPLPYWRDLGVGDAGADVAQLETLLRDGGFDPGEDDSRFTAQTARAVGAWQRATGQEADGTFRVGAAAVAAWPARVEGVAAVLGRFVTPDQVLLDLATVERVAVLAASGRDRPLLDEGLAVELTAAAGGPALTGTLAELADVPTETEDGAVRFDAIVTLEDDRSDLADGASLIGDVVVARAVDVVVVPVPAIGADAAGDPVVTIVDGSSHRQVDVGLGIQQDGLVEVREGVAAGDVVRVPDG